MKEALALAEDNNGKVAEWLIQDILIDLRNRENNIAETKNQYLRKTEGQKGLDNRQEKLYYPLIDRNEKNLLEWIEKERFEELCRLDGTSNHDVERKSLFYIIAGNLDSREHLTSIE